MPQVPREYLDGETRVTVLLVEDEPFVRMDVAETLRKARFEVVEAARADAALEFIQAGKRIDVVFTEVQTPGVLDGLGLAERVRAKFPTTPVILTSGNTNLEDAASRLGKFLRKPYHAAEIANLVAEVVGSLP